MKMSKFKKNNIVKDDCGCEYKILLAGWKYYTCNQVTDKDNFKFKIEINELDNRAKLIKKGHNEKK